MYEAMNVQLLRNTFSSANVRDGNSDICSIQPPECQLQSLHNLSKCVLSASLFTSKLFLRWDSLEHKQAFSC